MSNYFGIDIGGTNLRISQVNPENGELVGKLFLRNISNLQSNSELTDIILEQIPQKCNVGISAAGVVDEKNLINITTNLKIKEPLTFGKELRDKGYNVSMTNDLRAAIQSIVLYGEGKNFENVLLAGYSTGFNCALVRDGKNVSTAEFGHMTYDLESDMICGCGGKGHLELFVSSKGAELMAKKYFLDNNQFDSTIINLALNDYNENAMINGKQTISSSDLHNEEIYSIIVNSIGAKQVYTAFKKNPSGQPQQKIQNTQIKAIAQTFGMMVCAYNPIDAIFVIGNQTNDWDSLFAPALRLYEQGDFQHLSLPKPKIIKPNIIKEFGIQGAVAYMLNNK